LGNLEENERLGILETGREEEENVSRRRQMDRESLPHSGSSLSMEYI
jgi:hypothetical protein